MNLQVCRKPGVQPPQNSPHFSKSEREINNDTDDGTCAIDLLAKYGHYMDETTGLAIYRAAKSIIDGCVSPRRIGGERNSFCMSNFLSILDKKDCLLFPAPHGGLIVTVRKYDRSGLSCIDTPTKANVQACDLVVNPELEYANRTAIFERQSRTILDHFHVPYDLQREYQHPLDGFHLMLVSYCIICIFFVPRDSSNTHPTNS